jgi:general secretion pathway protein B
MSFILDALKKSETERQRQSVPGLMDAGGAPSRPYLPRWAIALGILLGINLIVLIIVLVRNAAPAPLDAAAPPHAPAAAAAGVASAQAPHFSPLDAPPAASAAAAAPALADAAPEYAPEIPVDGADDAPSAHKPPAAGHAARPAGLHRDPLLSDAADSDNDEVLPSMSELNLTGADGLPELHIDVHVFATKPSDRFVYINMRKYREGATLQEGPVLERIRRDGAVLDYHGLRFLLPRQ